MEGYTISTYLKTCLELEKRTPELLLQIRSASATLEPHIAVLVLKAIKYDKPFVPLQHTRF